MFLCFWLFALPSYLFHDFHLLNNPLPLRNARGFSFPRNIPTKNFSENFFKSTPSDFFLIFWREFVMRGTAACSLPMGGVLLFCGLVGFSFPLFLSFLSLLRLCRRLPFLSSYSVLVGFLPFIPGLCGSTPALWECLNPSGGSGLWEHSKQLKRG